MLCKGFVVIVIIFLIVTVQSQNEHINNGLNAANGVASLLKDGNFREAITDLGKNIGPWVGAIGPIVSMVMAFIPGGDSAELAYMKQAFKEVNNKLDSLHAEFYEVKNMIDWSTVQVSYQTQEKKIRAMMSLLQLAFEAPHGDARENQRKYFVMQYESDFQNSAQKIYSGIVNNDHLFSFNLVEASVKYTENHRRKVQRFMLGLIQLLMQGVEVQLAYYQMKGYEPNIDHIQKEWEARIANVNQQMLKTDQAVANRWHDQSGKDIDHLASNNRAMSNKDFMGKLYYFLIDKYDWRYWFVLVYDDIKGYSKHCVRACGGHTKFRLHGRNVVASSRSKDQEINFDKNDANNILIRAKYPRRNHAERLYWNLPDRVTKTCTPYAFKGVVRHGCNAWFKCWNNHVHYKKHFGGGLTGILFG